MKKARLAAQSRSQLDERFRELGPAKRYTPPVRGWIKALREALGMSTAQLAKRLGIKQPSLVALEQSEAKGTIERIDQSAVERLGHAPQCGQLDGSLCFGLFERHQGRLLDPQPLRELRR